MSSTNGSNRSPRSNLGKGERWKREREVIAWERENEGEGAHIGEGLGNPHMPRADLGHAVGRADYPLLDIACF
jgi:hypothetical protein